MVAMSRGSSVGWGRVCDRVRVVKSYRRSLRVTVRPENADARNRWPTRAAIESISRPSTARSVRSRSNVSSCDTDFTPRSGTTCRSSSARASAYSPAPWAFPDNATRSVSDLAARSATVLTPTWCRRSAVAGPTPPRRVTGNGWRTPSSVPGATTTRPSGFCRSEPILAISLDVPMPTDPARPRAAAGRRGDPVLELPAEFRHTRDGQVVSLAGGQVDVGLVQGRRLDQGRQLAQQGHDDIGGPPVRGEPAAEERRPRGAPAPRLRRRHRRPGTV